jgi:hypothetical protein
MQAALPPCSEAAAFAVACAAIGPLTPAVSLLAWFDLRHAGVVTYLLPARRASSAAAQTCSYCSKPQHTSAVQCSSSRLQPTVL